MAVEAVTTRRVKGADPKRWEIKNPADAAIVDEARDINERAIRKLGRTGGSPLAFRVMSFASHVYTWKEKTYAVTSNLRAEPFMLANPAFVKALGVDGAMFALSHEAMHVILGHLLDQPHRRPNQRRTLAREVFINHLVMGILKCQMPSFNDPETGEPGSLIDPNKVYDEYVDKLTDAGETPAGRGEFFYDEDSVYRELCRVPQVEPPEQTYCDHMDAEPGSGGAGERGEPGDSSGSAGAEPGESDGEPSGSAGGSGDGTDGDSASGSGDGDQERKALDDLARKAIEGAIDDAVRRNSKTARDELNKIVDAVRHSEQGQKAMSAYGAGRLDLGETSTRPTSVWEKVTRGHVQSLISPRGSRWKYNRKITWERRISPIGKERQRLVVVACDVSGSMPAWVLEKFRTITGASRNVKTVMVVWDGEVRPFKAGEGISGGGGTNVGQVEEWIREQVKTRKLPRYPDAVVSLTDGFCDHFTPAHPDRWVWVITPTGDDWPKDHTPAMKTVRFDAIV